MFTYKYPFINYFMYVTGFKNMNLSKTEESLLMIITFNNNNNWTNNCPLKINVSIFFSKQKL